MNTLHKAKILESSQGFRLWEEPEIKKKLHDLICDSCGYKTTIRTNLKKHKLTHERVKKDKITSCDKCDYTSSKEANVKRHKENFKHVKEEGISTKYRKLKALKKEFNKKLKKEKDPGKVFGENEVKKLIEDFEGSQRDILKMIKWMRKYFGRQSFTPKMQQIIAGRVLPKGL